MHKLLQIICGLEWGLCAFRGVSTRRGCCYCGCVQGSSSIHTSGDNFIGYSRSSPLGSQQSLISIHITASQQPVIYRQAGTICTLHCLWGYSICLQVNVLVTRIWWIEASKVRNSGMVNWGTIVICGERLVCKLAHGYEINSFWNLREYIFLFVFSST